MYDCGFTKENNWFRYRAGAIIIENGCILFAGNDNEEMHWIPIEDLDKYRAFPSFLKDYLNKAHFGIEHIITDVR
ncbi:MAG: hypothetical protein KIG62_10135 [Oscillospiraceae bacterium]|nr:hypothetical protein [Oscillospiraceae bacterium]